MSDAMRGWTAGRECCCYPLILLLWPGLLLLLLCQPVHAQTGPDASEDELMELSTAALTRLYNSTGEDAHRVKLLVIMGERQTYKPGENIADLDSGRAYLQAALQLNKKVGSVEWGYNALMEMGALYYEYENKTDSALYWYNTAINLARKNKDTREEAMILANLAYRTPIYKRDFLNKRLEYCTRAFQLFYSLNKDDEKGIDMLKNMADCHFNLAQYALAEKELKQVLDMYNKIHFKKLHFTYDLLSAVSRMKGDLPQALSYAILAVNSMEETKDSVQAGYFYRRMADAYDDIGNRTESLLYSRKCFEAFKRQSTTMLYPSLVDLAGRMISEGQAAEAVKLVNETTQHYPVVSGMEAALAIVRGDCYKAMRQYALAEQFYLQALNPGNGSTNTFDVYYDLADLYVMQQKYAAAAGQLNYLLEKEAIKYLPLARVRDVHLLLFKVDSATGHPALAINEYQQYTRLKDSLLNGETAKQMAGLQIQYQTREKEKDNELLRRQSQLQQKELDKSNQLRRFILAALLLLLFIIVLLYNLYKIKQRSNRQLQAQQKEIQDAYDALALSLTQKNRLLDEKEWLLKEIHHRVKNNLQLVMSLLNTQTHYLQDGVALTAINESRYRLRSISLIHQKLYQSDEMSAVDLDGYIKQLVTFLRESYARPAIRFVVTVAAVEVDVSVAVPLGLIINEAITNIFKYAYPDAAGGTVHLTLQQHPCALELVITDDGTGLPPGFDLQQSHSMGFTLIQGLAEQLDGELQVVAGPGLTIRLNFPLPEGHAAF
ncbi:tetratricopeptide repeat-containing sensor histidine kinase [Deminuibacter soli]|nr:sensor histidine kinase [Deminuibacter soli]